ncbi:MAG TPA: DUF1328 family protein [Kofleriaceae bacterium]|jgi:uncharacterized membrane protein YtjA (UPF0391 family)
MFSWVIALFVVGIIAAIFGFGSIASSVAGIAQIIFWAALILAIVGVVVKRTRQQKRPLKAAKARRAAPAGG